MTVDLAIVIPTLNEAGNIRPLIRGLDGALAGLSWEVVFVDDDSVDGTVEVIREVALERPNVRYLQRIGRRGLASACIEGMLSTPAPVLAVMDADLQHDEGLLPGMYRTLIEGGHEVVVASRFLEQSSLGTFSSARERLSRMGIRMSGWVCKAELSDPMSGFFMLRREVLQEVVRDLSGQGFKILLDIFASSERPLSFAEVPLHFRERNSGASKLDTMVMLEFISLVADKTLGRYVPVRFVEFVLVGLLGVIIHLLLLGAAFKGAGIDFYLAQGLATFAAMTGNFYFNNRLTYRDRRLRGRDFYTGLLSFYFACSIGALINLEMSSAIFGHGAGWALSGIVGAVVGSVWNFGITSTFTWNPKTVRSRGRSAAPGAPVKGQAP